MFNKEAYIMVQVYIIIPFLKSLEIFLYNSPTISNIRIFIFEIFIEITKCSILISPYNFNLLI